MEKLAWEGVVDEEMKSPRSEAEASAAYSSPHKVAASVSGSSAASSLHSSPQKEHVRRIYGQDASAQEQTKVRRAIRACTKEEAAQLISKIRHRRYDDVKALIASGIDTETKCVSCPFWCSNVLARGLIVQKTGNSVHRVCLTLWQTCVAVSYAWSVRCVQSDMCSLCIDVLRQEFPRAFRTLEPN